MKREEKKPKAVFEHRPGKNTLGSTNARIQS